MLIDMNSGTKCEGGMNITSATSGGMRTIRGLVDYVWTSPAEIMEIEDKEVAFYLHVLFALKEKNLMYIGGLFISSILDFFRFIEKNSTMLIEDLNNGKINQDLKINPQIRKKLNKKLGKCTKRATELKI